MPTTTHPLGRRAANRLARAELDTARAYGLAARRRVKLARLAATCHGQCIVCVCECHDSAGRAQDTKAATL